MKQTKISLDYLHALAKQEQIARETTQSNQDMILLSFPVNLINKETRLCVFLVKIGAAKKRLNEWC